MYPRLSLPKLPTLHFLEQNKRLWDVLQKEGVKQFLGQERIEEQSIEGHGDPANIFFSLELQC